MFMKMADSEMKNDSTVAEKKSCEGIIYISKVPPFMKPGKLKHLMSQFGEVGRVFLQPEDPLIRKRRKKTGGSGRKTFTEGWIEFKDRKIAKAVASSLNGTIIGGKKRGYYHDDIWNIKYLKKFKWGHISEKLAYEKAARDQRMRTEISQAKKEANFYLENVEKSKAISAIEERKKKKRKLKETDQGAEEARDIENIEQVMKKFKQRKVVHKSEKTKEKESTGSTGGKVSLSLLSKVFGK